MNHDPMCPSHLALPVMYTCRCDLIARVREDERMKAYADWDWPAFVVRRTARDEALRDAVEAVKATLDAGLATSSDGALYFFELDKDDPTIGYDVTFHKDSIVAAIEALGSER